MRRASQGARVETRRTSAWPRRGAPSIPPPHRLDQNKATGHIEETGRLSAPALRAALTTCTARSRHPGRRPPPCPRPGRTTLRSSMSTYRAFEATGVHNLRLVERDLVHPGPGHVRLRVEA